MTTYLSIIAHVVLQLSECLSDNIKSINQRLQDVRAESGGAGGGGADCWKCCALDTQADGARVNTT